MEQIIEYKNIEYCLKSLFISIFTIYLNCKILNIKLEKNDIKNIKTVLELILSVMFSMLINLYHDRIIGILMLDIFIAFTFANMTNRSISFSLIITTISMTTNFILYSIAIALNYLMFKIFNITNEYIVLIGIIVIYSIIFYLLCKIKRIKNGITLFKKNENNEYFIMLILNDSCIVFLIFTIILKIDTSIIRTLFIYIIIFAIIMFITIQKSLQLYYKQKLQEREVEEIKEELKNKNKEIEGLEKENLKLNKKNHSIAHKQKSLEYELEQMALNNGIVDENHVKDKIENLSKEMQDETVSMELTKTGINEIDSMLKYMQSECVKNKIDFQLQINGNIHHMVNTYIGKEDLEILIADLIKNAIIAINHSENINKSILVRLGIIDGAYSLYVYDSGIEFEIETLNNLGTKPSTTHADDGGTGMGWMNTFDTLKKYKASLIIDEYGKPVEDNFTKVIKIVFDNRNEYKIESYRKEEMNFRGNP